MDDLRAFIGDMTCDGSKPVKRFIKDISICQEKFLMTFLWRVIYLIGGNDMGPDGHC